MIFVIGFSLATGKDCRLETAWLLMYVDVAANISQSSYKVDNTLIICLHCH